MTLHSIQNLAPKKSEPTTELCPDCNKGGVVWLDDENIGVPCPMCAVGGVLNNHSESIMRGYWQSDFHAMTKRWDGGRGLTHIRCPGCSADVKRGNEFNFHVLECESLEVFHQPGGLAAAVNQLVAEKRMKV